MAIPGFKEKLREFLRCLVDFIFGFKNKKGDILDYWIAFSDALNLPPQEFYASVETELAARNIPGMEITREEFAEGGLLSDKRMYLRLFRERLAIYICASPFGTGGYFFSCRTVYVPALVRLWHILAACFFLSIVGGLLAELLGPGLALIALVALLFAIGGVFQNAAAAAVGDLDALLLKIPVVGTIYEDWFRADTYYRSDTRLVYLQRIPALVKELADEVSAANGAKLMRQYEFAPVFGDLYKPRSPRPDDRPPPLAKP